MSGGKFMWSNNQPMPTLEKLDEVLMYRDWEDIFPHVVINKLPREILDYNPLLMYSDVNQPLQHLYIPL